MSKADEIQLSMLFVQVEYKYDQDERQLNASIGLKYKYRRDIQCRQLGMYNRKVCELLNQLNQDNQPSYCMLDMDQIDFPVLMIHACCLNKQQSDKYFGEKPNWKQGLCMQRQPNIYHNCLKNNLFFLDNYLARLHRMLYWDA